MNELPKQVKDNLPSGAQNIFKEAYNNIWDQYNAHEDRRGDESLEEVANKVAWFAVKKNMRSEAINGLRNRN